MSIKGLPPQIKRNMRDVAPLNAPYVIGIYPTDLCNIRCGFCQYHGIAGNIGHRDVMTFDMYKTVIDSLLEFDTKINRIVFSGFGEPTLHKDLPEMIAYANRQQVAHEVMLITNGLLLNPELNMKLIEAELNYIKISVPAIDNETARQITRCKIDVMTPYVENIKHLFRHKSNMTVLCKTTDRALNGNKEGLSPSSRAIKRFYEMYEDACDYCMVENVEPFAGIDEELLKKQGFSKLPSVGLQGAEHKPRKACEFWFYRLEIDPRGNVRPCCHELAPVLGNLADNGSVYQIWKSDRLRNYQLANLRGNIEVCKDCALKDFSIGADIDGDIDELYSRLSRNDN